MIQHSAAFNSLVNGRTGSMFKKIIAEHMILTNLMSMICEIANDSALVQAMA